MTKVLTAKAVEKIGNGPARREIADKLLPGLYLVVQPSGGSPGRCAIASAARAESTRSAPSLP
jgi:hypothetical protein